MEKVRKYTVSELHVLLCQVCETDRQKRQYKVIQDLQFYCKLSESEAVTIWKEAITKGILKQYNTYEQDGRFKTYSYDGVFTGEESKKDYSDMGVGATYHNNKDSGLAQSGRYATDRKENKLRTKPQKQRP